MAAQSTLEMLLRSRKQGTGAKEMKQELTDLKGAVGALGLSAQLTAAGGIALLTSQFVQAIGRLERLERLENQTNAVIRSTGGVAGVSAEQVLRYAESLERTSLFEMEAVQNAENLLLTFTKIGQDTFPSATQAVVDMAAAMGGDLQGAAIQVGKALQDPILGVTALRRVGVNFSKDQMAVIKSLVDTGDAAKAQALILKELATEFGGSAAAQAEGLSGELHVLKESVDGVTEALAERAVPTLTRAAQALNILLNQDRDVAQVLEDHEREVRSTAASYMEYVDEMLRANVVAGNLRESQAALVREFILTGEGGMQAQVALEGVVVATQGAYDAAQTYDDRLESIQRKGAITTQIEADVAPLDAKLAEYMNKHPGRPAYWAALDMQVDARAVDAVTASRLAFLEWLRLHPEMHLTIYEQVEMATGTGDKSYCFVAGTPVRLASGEELPIEDVAIGDIVEAYDPELGLPCEAAVTDTLRRQADHVNVLEFSNGAEIRVTDEHPFLTPTGWICARELTPGVSVLEADGRLAILETTRRVWGEVKVFNLTVAEPHTFVVAGLVVHNKVKQARGGPLASVALVGEEGPEYIINGVVVPAAETRKLMALGLKHDRAFGTGGAEDVYVPPTPTAPINPDPYGGTGNAPSGGSQGGMSVDWGGTFGGEGGGGGGPSQAVSAAALQTVAMQAAVTASAGVAAAMPTAVAQQLAAQNAITERGQDRLIRAVEILKNEIATAVRDAVAQAP